jgi:hypothetical protein
MEADEEGTLAIACKENRTLSRDLLKEMPW